MANRDALEYLNEAMSFKAKLDTLLLEARLQSFSSIIPHGEHAAVNGAPHLNQPKHDPRPHFPDWHHAMLKFGAIPESVSGCCAQAAGRCTWRLGIDT